MLFFLIGVEGWVLGIRLEGFLVGVLARSWIRARYVPGAGAQAVFFV